MKKSTIILIAIFSIVAIAFTALFVWWFSPVSLLKGVEADNVTRIRVFNGSTGTEFYIDDAYNIGEIVTDIKNAKLYKSGISENEDGFSFSLSFYDGETLLDELIVNGAGTIRKDPFFYEDRDESLPFDWLENYEKYAFLKAG